MSHSRGGNHTNTAILEDIANLCIDDQAHTLLLGCRPQQPELTVLLQERDRSTAQPERDRGTRELWADVRDARRALRI